MRTILRASFLTALFACLAHADGVQPIVAPGQVLFGSNGHTITSSSDLIIDTTTHVVTFKKQAVFKSSVTFNDGTFLVSTNGIVAASLAWGNITGTLSNQADLQTKFNLVGASTVSLATSIVNLGASTGTLNTSIINLGASTGTLNTSIINLGVSTGTLNTSIINLGVSTGTLSTSTTSLQNQINSHFPVSLSTGTTGTLQPSQMVSSVAYTTANQTFSGQNNWTTPLPSTFTFSLVVGSLTVNDLATSSFVVTNASKKLVSFDLFGTANNFTGSQSFTSVFGNTFAYGNSFGSMTITGLLGVGPLRGGPSTVVSTGPVNLATEVTGNLGVSNLDSGTNADLNHFWAGSGHWLTVPTSGGASTMAASTGSATTSVIVSSPTKNFVVDSNLFTGSLSGSTSFFLTLNLSSVTAQGNTFNVANKLVKLSAGSQFPASDGNLITNLNAANLSGIFILSSGTVTGQLTAGTFVGNGAGITNVSIPGLIINNNNEVIGLGAWASHTSGTHNFIAGWQAATNATSASDLTIIGEMAGAPIISNTNILAMGINAAGDQIYPDASHITTVGDFSGSHLASATYSSYFGDFAGSFMGGSQNTCIGGQSCSRFSATFNTAANETCTGMNSCASDASASSNTVSGSGAGANDSSGSGSGNSLFGYMAVAGAGGSPINNAGCMGQNCITLSSNTFELGQRSNGMSLLINAKGGVVPYALRTSTNSGDTTPNYVQVSTSMHITSRGPAPTLGSCGGATFPSVVGDDNAGVVTLGAGGGTNTCAMAFALPWGVIPSCNFSVLNSTTSLQPYIVTTSSFTVTLDPVFNNGSGLNKFSYRCTCGGSSCL